tara:strand:- start:21 stop:221 length:201 start_codon:yes stop_codon:yes gene_type:complete
MDFVRLVNSKDDEEVEILITVVEEAIDRHCSNEQIHDISDYVERRIEIELQPFGSDDYLLGISELR